jgi:hypothetical protein
VKGEFEFTDVDDYPTRVGLSKRDGYTFGVGGHWRPLFGQLAGDIRLGTAIWRDPEIHSAKSNRIGSRSLASWKLVLDQKKKMLWLLEDNLMMTTTWTGRMEPDGRSSVYGFVSIAEGDGFIVQEVDFGSRAERAGLKVGDRYTWKSAHASTPGESLEVDASRFRLHVIRGSEKHEITMALSDPLPVINKSARTTPSFESDTEQD